MSKTVRLLNVSEIQGTTGGVHKLGPKKAEGHSDSANFVLISAFTQGVLSYPKVTPPLSLSFASLHMQTSWSQPHDYITGALLQFAVQSGGGKSRGIAAGGYQRLTPYHIDQDFISNTNSLHHNTMPTSKATNVTSDGEVGINAGGFDVTNSRNNITDVEKWGFSGSYSATGWGNLTHGGAHYGALSNGDSFIVDCRNSHSGTTNFTKGSFSSNSSYTSFVLEDFSSSGNEGWQHSHLSSNGDYFMGYHSKSLNGCRMWNWADGSGTVYDTMYQYKPAAHSTDGDTVMGVDHLTGSHLFTQSNGSMMKPTYIKSCNISSGAVASYTNTYISVYLDVNPVSISGTR